QLQLQISFSRDVLQSRRPALEHTRLDARIDTRRFESLQSLRWLQEPWRERCELIDRLLHLVVRFRSAAAEPLQERIGVLDVNLLLGDEPAGELSQWSVARFRQPAQPKEIEVVAEKVATEGGRPVELIG